MNEREDEDLEAELGLFNPNKPVASQDDNVPASPNVPSKLNERNLPYDISEEKLLTAAAQLVDVYNKRTKASATITVQKKTASDPIRNRSMNIVKQPMRSSFAHPVPNFVVTKITEKSPNTVLNKSSTVNVAKIANPVKIVHRTRPDDVERTKRMVAVQRQKSLQIFNTFAPNAVKNLDRKKLAQPKTVFDANNFQVKSMSVSNKNAGNVDFVERSKTTIVTPKSSTSSQANTSSQNEPVILNFRTKVHEAPPKPKPVEKVPINGRNNASSYRVLEISPVTKNSMEKATVMPKTTTTTLSDRFFMNRPQLTSYKPLAVTKDYSRSPLNRGNNSGVLWRSKSRYRARLARKFPSMSNLTALSNEIKAKENANASNADSSSNLKRSNSCFIFGEKCNPRLFEHALQNSNDCVKLYELCANVIDKLCFKGQTVRRKRGRPKKKVYKSLTRDLLNTPEFSWRADIQRIKEWPFDGQAIFHENRRRSRRCAFLSIEPIIPDIEATLCKSRDRSPVSSFQINRLPLKTYSRANLIQPRVTLDSKRFDSSLFAPSKPQIQLLNIEPLSSTSQIDLKKEMKIEEIKEEVSQSTEYIVDSFFDSDEYNMTEEILVEYLDENDEIESPAYEPLTTDVTNCPSSPITGEADTTVETYSQPWERIRPKKPLSITHNFSATTSVNEKGSQQIELKYLNTNESDAHSTTDITEIYAVCDDDDDDDDEDVDSKLGILPTTDSMQKKVDLNLSPVRKSTRKRKIPSEFPNFAKRVRS